MHTKARLPSENAFALGTKRKEKGDKQHEIDMANAQHKLSARIGVVVGSAMVRKWSSIVCIRSARLFRSKQVGTGNAKCSRWRSKST